MRRYGVPDPAYTHRARACGICGNLPSLNTEDFHILNVIRYGMIVRFQPEADNNRT